MPKRLQIILAITAIISFVLAVTLDITSFGQDRNISWKYIEIGRIFAGVAVIIAVGLLLALFLFGNQKYKERILLTIPIAFLLFSFASISHSAINYYGLNEDYNYFSAKQDIKKGKIQIFETGLPLPEPNIDWAKKQDVVISMGKYFGYTPVYLGCEATHGIEIYNNLMEDYLENVNGKNWRVKERDKIDSIMRDDRAKK